MLHDLIPRKPYIQINGENYFFDELRHKWLSSKRIPLTFSVAFDNIKSNRWLEYAGIPSNLTGYPIFHNSIITSISAFTSTINSGTFQICNDDQEILGFKLNLENRKSELLNIPVYDGYKLKVRVIDGKFDFPTVELELANVL